MAIIFQDVSKRLNKHMVIEHVNCTLQNHRIIGFQGINGSGKTMMMRLIAGLIYPSSGEVLINGKRLGKDISFPPSIGIMLENPAFLNDYNGYDNLTMLASVKGVVHKEEIDEVMERVGLKENGRKKYKKFSLGMKQRLGIAAAIMEAPDIVILDEPTNSLDEAGVELVKAIVLEEKERGATVILSCHDTKILDELADDIYHMESGRVKEN